VRIFAANRFLFVHFPPPPKGGNWYTATAKVRGKRTPQSAAWRFPRTSVSDETSGRNQFLPSHEPRCVWRM